MKNKNLWLLAGYGLLLLGVTATVMQVIGTHWVFLAWLELLGGLGAFLVKILMVIAGILIIVFARTDWEKEKQESQ